MLRYLLQSKYIQDGPDSVVSPLKVDSLGDGQQFNVDNLRLRNYL